MRMLQYLSYFSKKNTSQVGLNTKKPMQSALFIFILFQYEFIACHHGNEGAEELREILKKTGFIDSNIHFYSDSCEILRLHGAT